MGNLLSKAKPATANFEKMSVTESFRYYGKAQSDFKPPLISSDNAFLGDVYSSDKVDAEKPITCGFYRLEAGTPLVYKYDYHEMKIILEGEFDISDETGQEVHAVAGDVFNFPAGSTITFKTNTYGLAFYTGQRKEGTA